MTRPTSAGSQLSPGSWRPSFAAALVAPPQPGPQPLYLGRDRQLSVNLRGGNQLSKDLLQLLGLLGEELEAASVEELLGVTDGELGLDHAAAHRAEHLAQLCLGPDGAEHAGRGADHR